MRPVYELFMQHLLEKLLVIAKQRAEYGHGLRKSCYIDMIVSARSAGRCLGVVGVDVGDSALLNGGILKNHCDSISQQLSVRPSICADIMLLTPGQCWRWRYRIEVLPYHDVGLFAVVV